MERSHDALNKYFPMLCLVYQMKMYTYTVYLHDHYNAGEHSGYIFYLCIATK